MTQSWIFDFDGTLIDSAPAIKACYAKATQLIAPERLSITQNILIGPTLKDTSAEILGENLMNRQEDFIQIFQAEYDDGIVLETKQYADAEKLLKQLKARGDSIAIATNKRTNPTNALINHYGWGDYFEWVACLDEFNEQFKHKSEMVTHLLISNPNFKSAYFIGDTVNDGITANQNQLLFIRANYGYGINQNWNKINIFKNINSLYDLLF